MPIHPASRSPVLRPLAGVTAALLAALLSPLAIAGRMVERPGVAYAPAFVCVASVIKPDGFTMDTRLLRRSGNGQSDRLALRFVRERRFMAIDAEGEAASRPVFVLIRMHGNGQLAHRFFASQDDLPPICAAPFESVARDREINAVTDTGSSE